jgi:hypothetical protein
LHGDTLGVWGEGILQYADDTILLLEDDLEISRKFKYTMCIIEQMLCLKENFHK